MFIEPNLWYSIKIKGIVIMKATSGNNKKAVLNVVKYIIYYFKELPTIVVGSSLEFFK